MIDIISPDEMFSAAEFRTRAVEAIEEIRSRGKVPVLAGGTGFYINALLYGAEFSSESNAAENALREEFAALAREKGAEFLHERLAKADPVYAAGIHANNVKRVARALAFCEATGGLFSEYNALQKKKTPVFDAEFFVLSMPREILYERINLRTLAMFEAGLVEEVRNLLSKGYNKELAAMLAIGYKETVQFLHGEISMEETVAAIRQNTRRYAKRQETWFRNQCPGAKIIDAAGKTPGRVAELIERSNSHELSRPTT
jgi:tRNA dimethylallyltransferase